MVGPATQVTAREMLAKSLCSTNRNATNSNHAVMIVYVMWRRGENVTGLYTLPVYGQAWPAQLGDYAGAELDSI
jgi:hypothetical protein